ncbi:hypothetical protein OFC46_25070, partial [Escherichia coli]|nr:hypothetical protein [Escherichia coli]
LHYYKGWSELKKKNFFKKSLKRSSSGYLILIFTIFPYFIIRENIKRKFGVYMGVSAADGVFTQNRNRPPLTKVRGEETYIIVGRVR